MRIQEIRQVFLDYFHDKGHEIVSSSSLVPANDKTLLFTNAGMVQFKDVFLGIDKKPYSRATTAQRCVRAGGKHNDLENVGYTARHHTFFEMLGNFSFGDYFKEDAIRFAWELITKKFAIPASKIWVTVFEDDNEAYNIWANVIGVPKDRISRIGEKDNFWQMGETGPCGPCTEIFYDHGEHIWGGPPGTLEEGGDRFIEIWNLVFMQYDRQSNGDLAPLPSPSVDTGMGLERIAAILQGVNSNYEIDLFVDLIKSAADATNTNDLSDNSLKVIADHIRSVSFLLVDGVFPSNEGRGYVLRRIIRRAVRHGYKLGQKSPFLYKLVESLVLLMGDAYPEIKENKKSIEEQILREEKRFHRTIEDGMNLLDSDLDNLKGDTISGKTIFKLYDTYGFPADLTADIARERKLKVDLDGYKKAMRNQVLQSQTSGAFKNNILFKTSEKTEFLGYDYLNTKATIREIFVDNVVVNSVTKGNAVIVLDRTTFYAESGGQVGDKGVIKSDNFKFIVNDTQSQAGAILHFGYLEFGVLKMGDDVCAEVDGSTREAITRNHSATHLLHAALHKVLGTQALQKGSLVSKDRLRFDFSHECSVTKEQLDNIEELTNADVLSNYQIKTDLMNPEEAKEKGAMALFGEKYGDEVRVVSMGPNSIELCGGTHVKATGSIGQVIITSESGVASGVRRIEAVTGWESISYRRKKEEMLNKVVLSLKATPDNVESKIKKIFDEQSDLREKNKQLKKDKHDIGGSLSESYVPILADGYKIYTKQFNNYEIDELRDLADKIRDSQDFDLVVLATITNSKIKFVAKVAKKSIGKLHAGKIISQVAEIVGGKGGGRPDFAQAGGVDIDKVEMALSSVCEIIKRL